MKKVWPFLAAAVAVACIFACVPPPPDPPNGYQQMYITRDDADYYQFNLLKNGVNAQARTENSNGNNTRVVVWNATTSIERDHQSCATFNPTPWPIQEGVAVRIRQAHGEAGRAIAVMPNIFGAKSMDFNVQLLNTSLPVGAGRYTPLTLSQSFTAELQGHEYEPWRLCVRVINQALDFKVWPAQQEEPAWGATSHTRSFTLPIEWVYPGQGGLYVGHLTPGTSIDMVDHHTEVFPK